MEPEIEIESDSGPILSEESQDLTLDAEQVASPELDAEGNPVQEKPESKEPRDKRIAGFYTERSRADTLERENAELKQQQTQASQAATPAPDYDDFDTDQEYYAATAKHEAKQAIEAFKVEQTQGKVAGDRKSALEGFSQKVADANIPDYDVKANTLMDSVGMRPDTLEALYEMEGDKGPKVVAYLAEHLDVADGLTPFKLGQLSAQLSATKPVQQTKASNPITPIKPNGVVRKNLSDLSVEEIIDGDLKAYGINDR
jgi:hypothetical protein